MLEETDFTEPFPAGLLHAVEALVWNAVKAEPAVKAPESAAAEPTLIAGVWPVFVVVTPSKPQPAIRMPAAVLRFGTNINVAQTTTKTMAIVTGKDRDREMETGVDLDIRLPLMAPTRC